MSLYTISGELSPSAPFDFGKSLDFVGMFGPTAGEQSLAERMITKAVIVGGRPVVFRVASSGGLEEPRVEYTLFADRPFDRATQRAAADRIAFFLSLADDLRPLYALGQADPQFAPIVEQLYGYHQVKFLTPFECACWAILTQRNAMPIARKLKQALVEHFGAGLEVDGTRYDAVPDAGMLAAAAPEDLSRLVRNGRRAEYLGAVAQAFSGVDEGWLRAAPYDEAAAWLRGITGIGEWSASFVLLRGLGRLEQIPIGEQRLSDAAAKWYNAGQPLSEAAIEQIAGRYGAWQGYWAHYLRVAA